MASTMRVSAESSHRVIAENRPEMLRATLRKPENHDFLAQIGACLERARLDNQMTLEQLAAELHRDARQVRRWISGEERTQVDVVFSVPVLRWPFVVALAKLAGAEVDEQISYRRSA